MITLSSKQFAHIERGVLDSAENEIFASQLRAELLKAVLRGDQTIPGFLKSLAGYCSACEYILPESEEETDLLHQLRPRDSQEHTLMLACYRPTEQPELALIAEVPTLRPPADSVSKAVQSMYEENPYPRWRTLGDVEPIAEARSALFAGCGTGKDVLSHAKREPASEFIGIDLSRTSLAFALSKQREMRLTNVRLMHGDLLDVGLLAREFDYIVSAGVLHHMKEPVAGLRALKSVLKPDGTMLVAVYSRIARASQIAAVVLRKQLGIEPTREGILRFRAIIRALPPEHPARVVVRSRDFYSISGARDLLFHTCEHAYTIPELAKTVSDAGLEIREFGISETVRAKFHGLGFTDVTDLKAWEKAEYLRPGLFSKMYVLKVGHAHG